MKRPSLSAALATASALWLGALGASAQAGGVDVGVSVSISQPGVYGRIDIGRFPQPQVVVAQPVIIAPPPPRPYPGVVVVQPAPVQPVYMWVPPGHRKNWRKHCARYDACGTPVVFVRDEWYERNVAPRDRWEDKRRGHGNGKGKGRDDD
jgi:hypothetical protein